MKLLDIPQAIDDAIDMMVDPETGEILSEDEILALCESLEMERDKKVEYLAKVVINLKAEEEALANHKSVIDKKLSANRNRQNSIKKFVRLALNGENWKSEDGLASISYRTTKDTVKIDDINEVDEKYFRTPHTESNLSKTAIKEAIQAGLVVKGAHLEDSISTIIK